MSFWKDKWCREVALSISFPSLFALAANKEASVENVWDFLGEEDELHVFLGPSIIGN